MGAPGFIQQSDGQFAGIENIYAVNQPNVDLALVARRAGSDRVARNARWRHARHSAPLLRRSRVRVDIRLGWRSGVVVLPIPTFVGTSPMPRIRVEHRHLGTPSERACPARDRGSSLRVRDHCRTELVLAAQESGMVSDNVHSRIAGSSDCSRVRQYPERYAMSRPPVRGAGGLGLADLGGKPQADSIFQTPTTSSDQARWGGHPHNDVQRDRDDQRRQARLGVAARRARLGRDRTRTRLPAGGGQSASRRVRATY